jgi:glutaminyl-tRNA synthetase
MSNSAKPDHTQAASTSNFIRSHIEADLAAGRFQGRGWAGQPGAAALHANASADPAAIRTRFPPEPNGYLHLGHAKSICLNFGLAQHYNGACHLRFDDTNPEKEEQQYVDSIEDVVQWLGFDWRQHLYFASNYFDFMYSAAEYLISADLAYVDEQSAEEMRANRGTLTQAGHASPWRNRPSSESLAQFRAMRAGQFADGAMVLRAKIDMASPNINLRDPTLYRIRRATHHRTGDTWCIYPMYTYAHPIEDALERITHSICTLEFADQRPFYDWLLSNLATGGLLAAPLPQQIEFARLNLSHVVLSKRKLIQLVEEGHVDGWDDPRLPTLAGARRRGYPAAGLRLFAERIGVAKADAWIDYSILEDCMREHLNTHAERRIGVLDPLRLVIDNYPESQQEDCLAPNHPQQPELGKRIVPLTRALWIEREDFQEVPAKGYFRLFPGNRVRLRYGYVVECTGCEKDATGRIHTVHCNYLPNTKSGAVDAEPIKVKGNIHWLSTQHAITAEVRLYDRLFTTDHPGAGDRDFLLDINPNARTIIQAQIESSLTTLAPGTCVQFERHGYFVADLQDSKPTAPVFNRTVTLRDSWSK